jgi:hypothetical protein
MHPHSRAWRRFLHRVAPLDDILKSGSYLVSEQGRLLDVGWFSDAAAMTGSTFAWLVGCTHPTWDRRYRSVKMTNKAILVLDAKNVPTMSSDYNVSFSQRKTNQIKAVVSGSSWSSES